MAKKRKYSRVLRGLGQSPFDDTGGYFDYNYEPVEQVTTEETGILSFFRNKFDEAILALDSQVARLNEAEIRLFDVQLQASKNESDIAEWQSNYNKIIATQSIVNSAQNAVNEVSSWWNNIKSTFGLSGMGLLPAIPWGTIAIITAGTASIAAIIASANAFIDRMNLKAWNDENIARSQQGLEPLPRPEPTSNQSIFAGATEFGKMAIIGFVMFFLIPPLIERMRK